MSGPMSATVFSENQVRLAEEHFRRGNLAEAIEIVDALTFGCPNTSANHLMISQALVAYQIHWMALNNNSTHYDVLRISNPYCCYQTIQRKYVDLVVKLCASTNKSAAAKSAFTIINTAWRVLSDPVRRRDYDIEQGFDMRIIYPEDEPQSVRQGKRHCIQVIDDSNSDSDSD